MNNILNNTGSSISEIEYMQCKMHVARYDAKQQKSKAFGGQLWTGTPTEQAEYWKCRGIINQYEQSPAFKMKKAKAIASAHSTKITVPPSKKASTSAISSTHPADGIYHNGDGGQDQTSINSHAISDMQQRLLKIEKAGYLNWKGTVVTIFATVIVTGIVTKMLVGK